MLGLNYPLLLELLDIEPLLDELPLDLEKLDLLLDEGLEFTRGLELGLEFTLGLELGLEFTLGLDVGLEFTLGL